MNTTGKILTTAIITSVLAVGSYKLIENISENNDTHKSDSKIVFANSSKSIRAANDEDFISAAKAITPAVVHIKTLYNSRQASNSWQDMWGIPQQGPVAMGSGSGIAITKDGYIATNNHVIENASGIEVIFPDRRVFKAELVGRDPNTDLAVLKIKGSDLPIAKFGDSDIAQVGEWVLAVGYPFSLNTTVTAGIISAKGRSIGILSQTQRREFSPGASGQVPSSAVESFIQTDAAINPGNSGGALVNTNGELVGINSAIASQTGSYAGYGFAIPSNLASKILDDLIKFGEVKRGFLGITFPTPLAEDEFLKSQGIKPGSVDGVFITGVQEGSAAAEAGLKEGDIIQSIDGVAFNSSSEFSEKIARQRPGDKIKLSILRDGKTLDKTVVLKGEESASLASSNTTVKEVYQQLGAEFSPVPNRIKENYNLKSGVVVTSVIPNGFFDQVGIREGTIISTINGIAVSDAKDIYSALSNAEDGRIQILGIAPDGSRVLFNFSIGA